MGTDFECDGGVIPVALNDLDGCSHALNGKATASGYMDASVETYIGQQVAHTLRADGFDASEDGTGRGTPLVPARRAAELPEIAGTMPAAGGTERKHGHGWGQQERENGYCIPVAFDTTQITSRENRSNPRPGDPAPTLVKDMHAPPAVAFPMRGRDGESQAELDGEVVSALRAADGGSTRPFCAFNIFPAHGQGADLEANETEISTAVTRVTHGQSTDRGTRIDDTGAAWDVRRLTVVECERLQGFSPESFVLTLHVWPSIDQARTAARAERKCLKSLDSAWIAAASVWSDRVVCAERRLHSNLPSRDKPVAASVLINLERQVAEIRSQGRLLWSALTVEGPSQSRPRMPIDGSVLQHVHMLRDLVRTTQIGEAGLHPRVGLSTLPLIGSVSVHLCGSEISEHAADADRSIADLIDYLKSITCEVGPNTDRFAWSWATWCCSAASVISSFIHAETPIGNSFSIEFVTQEGWTRVPVSISRQSPSETQLERYPDRYEALTNGEWITFGADGPRYKAIGNSMATHVMAWIGRRLLAAHPKVRAAT